MHKSNSIKKRAWEFYAKWRKNPSYCPAFKARIKISRKGWYHLVGGKSYTKRSFPDVMRRLYLLPKAKEIIEKSTTIQDVEKRYGRTFYALEAIVEVKEKNKKASRKVRVILIEDKKGNKTFYSVMDRKRRNQSK